MLIESAKWVVVLFGAFILLVGLLMLFNPQKARLTLRKAGSTNVINYMEITLRLIPAVSLIVTSDSSKLPIGFKLLGWIMVITSLMLYVVPRKIHHQFAMKSADILKPKYIQIIAPIALLFGGLIIYNVL
ncbi:hypothetical protein GCM10007383_10170 [Arenibacter certesii]|uniref:Uncharacterized protein n=2 Tax=Arenibacter certesii TaxID=228955 RepID=A0A918IQI2_9FLAO|nr:hypothetical protein GCM10007383_10170 [Arenibacter certesii]